MNVHREVVVRIDTEGDPADIARRLARGLVEFRIVVDLPRHDLTYGPGPAAATAIERGTPWVDHGDTEVSISTERTMYNAFGQAARPNCDRCGTQADRLAVQTACDAWFVATEPDLTCQACGWTALVGDWPAPWPFAVGAPAVVFENWPPLDPQFLSEVRALIGGRTRVVRVSV